MKIFGSLVYKILVWPGVIVHELSHLIGALITLTPVRGFSVLPERSDDGEFILGKVTHDATDNPFKQVIISTFPFFGGAVSIWFLAHFLMPGFEVASPVIHISSTGALQYVSDWFVFLRAFILQINVFSWTTWLFLYLTLAISAHLAPSNYDLLYALGGIFEVGFIVAAIALFLNTVGTGLNVYIIPWVGYVLGVLILLFAYILALLICMVIIAGILFLLITKLSLFTKRV